MEEKRPFLFAIATTSTGSDAVSIAGPTVFLKVILLNFTYFHACLIGDDLWVISLNSGFLRYLFHPPSIAPRWGLLHQAFIRQLLIRKEWLLHRRNTCLSKQTFNIFHRNVEHLYEKSSREWLYIYIWIRFIFFQLWVNSRSDCAL